MNQLEQQLLDESTGGTTVRLSVQTKTRIDAGRWWRNAPVWLCLTDEEVILLAVGRRQYLERIAIADCPRTHYNHASGELVLEPTETILHQRLKLPPSEALKILDHFKSKHSTLNT